jgi:glutamyl-tRNA synthetase
MATLNIASKANQATTFPALLVAHYAKESDPNASINVHFEEVEALKSGEKAAVELVVRSGTSKVGTENVTSGLIEAYPFLQSKHENLVGSKQALPYKIQALTVSQVKEWLARSTLFLPTDFKSVEGPLHELDAHLTLRSHVVGYTLTVADLSVWGAIRGNKVAYTTVKKGNMLNVSRWFKFVDDTNLWIAEAITLANAQVQAKRSAKSSEGASYDIALPDTNKGVVTRFPPEPSGYLHIGHAKAALLNDYFAHEKYKGTLICRFDDTNPSKEKEEFQDAIVEDLALMGIRPDKTSYTSDYFDELYQYCITMLKEGNAYADDTEQETMKKQRWDGLPSERRNASVEDNLAHFEEMKQGTTEGARWCVRAKISVDNPNKAMRDPVIYRCNLLPHHRTGNKWKMYPIYDFCCPIVDSMEGVTHALRTIEYRDRNPQYDWMLEKLDLRKVHIWDFARMNFIRTFLSKRKLTKLVDEGRVWGWDDPRFPTIRGIRRRGMTIDALREFILKQGPSRNIVNLDWTLFWATNKKYIDPVAPRHTAISKEHIVTARVKGARLAPYTEDKPKHGKNPELGLKKVAYSDEILIEQTDARNFVHDEELTLMNWGNAYVRKISHSLNPLTHSTVTALELELHLQGDVKTTKQKVTWLSTKGQELIPVELVDFDYLITKDIIEKEDDVELCLNDHTEFRSEAFADCNVADLQKDDVIQFERKGYFRVDRPFQHGKPAVLFNIPTGKATK